MSDAVHSAAPVRAVILLLLFLTLCFPAHLLAGPALAIQANSNRVPAGTLENGILTIHLELRQGDWYPESDTGPSMKMDAFAEEGKPLQVPAPLIRVPEGTEIRMTIHNLLPAAAVLHGIHEHPGKSEEVIRVDSGDRREIGFKAGVPGTYEYWASAGGDMTYTAHGRPYQEDSQLAGAFVVDPREGSPPDRVFVLGLWRSQKMELIAQQVAVINGKSWPYSERLNYTAGEPVRWRFVNASDAPHPMHLHGSFYRVDSVGDGESDRILPPPQRETVVTHNVASGATFTTFWTPLAGRWIVHCHLLLHIRPEITETNALAGQGPGQNKFVKDIGTHSHGLDHMGGMVMGITVEGKYAPVASHGRAQKLRLFVRERPGDNGTAGFGYQVEAAHKVTPAKLTFPGGPALVLERGRPVEITVVNQLHEATTVHWHGMELESYYDGVSGWDGDGRQVAPEIAPGHSFRVRFTPPRSGTFMYHTHMNDEAQLGGGLYGPLLVLEPGATYEPETDVIFLVSRDGVDALKAPLLVNGRTEPPSRQWKVGQRYRLRLINITPFNGAAFSLLGPSGVLKWRAVAKDGAALPPSQAVLQEARQVTLPGETYDFEYQPDQPGRLELEVGSARVQMKVTQAIEVR